jgi:hypothetical protein
MNQRSDAQRRFVFVRELLAAGFEFMQPFDTTDTNYLLRHNTKALRALVHGVGGITISWANGVLGPNISDQHFGMNTANRYRRVRYSKDVRRMVRFCLLAYYKSIGQPCPAALRPKGELPTNTKYLRAFAFMETAHSLGIETDATCVENYIQVLEKSVTELELSRLQDDRLSSWVQVTPMAVSVQDETTGKFFVRRLWKFYPDSNNGVA